MFFLMSVSLRVGVYDFNLIFSISYFDLIVLILDYKELFYYKRYY